MFKRKNEEKKKNDTEIKDLPEGIVNFWAIDTYRVLWLEPNMIEEHNGKYFIPLIGWYSITQHGRYTASLTKVNGELMVNPHSYTVRPLTDYAIRYPDHWVEVTLVYEQELPFDD